MKPFNLKSFIVQLLRRGTYRFPFRNEALKKVKVEHGRYTCNMCKQVYWRREVYIDHIEPVVGIEGFIDWNTYIARMFPITADAFQVLCKTCHDLKTKDEKEARKRYKRRFIKSNDDVVEGIVNSLKTKRKRKKSKKKV